MRKFLLILALVAWWCGPAASRVEALDPVTLAILTPAALKTAQVMWPYVMHGAQCGGMQLINCGRDIFDILRLPLGAVQSTLGAPFGFLGDGLNNLVLGGIAPFKLVWDILVLPITFCGIAPSGG